MKKIQLISLTFFIPVLLLSCANNNAVSAASMVPRVEIAAVIGREVSDEIHGFGSLTFIRKTDVASPSDAVVKSIPKREGDYVNEGEIVCVLENPQITISVRRAESAFSHAISALDLSRARLSEGLFNAEARLLDNEKTEAELRQARRALDEQRRKQESEEILFCAGGVSVESIRDSRFRLESAEVQLDLLEKDLEIRRIGLREIDLLAAGIVPPGDEGSMRSALITLATAGLRAEVRAAEANLESSRRELESNRLLESSLVIHSPMSGIVGARFFEEGERVKREDRILTLMDTKSLYAIFPAPEAEALRLVKGMPASVSIDGTGDIYIGKVDLVSPQADSQSFTFMVRVLLESFNGNTLKPGMFARITVPLEQPHRVILVPETSLIDRKNGQGRVFTIRGNVVSERVVGTGRLFGDEREILSGLTVGDVVVQRPNSALKDGAYVSIPE